MDVDVQVPVDVGRRAPDQRAEALDLRGQLQADLRAEPGREEQPHAGPGRALGEAPVAADQAGDPLPGKHGAPLTEDRVQAELEGRAPAREGDRGLGDGLGHHQARGGQEPLAVG